MTNACMRTILATCLAAWTLPAQAQDAGADVNSANNPLTPKITLNLQDYYIPDIKGVPDRHANQFLLRGLVPSDIGGVPQLLRFTLPIATTPEFPSGYKTGLGDLTLMDIFLFPGKVSYGIGPLVVLPTATNDLLGQGKWQAGAAGVVVAPQSWGLIGGLATYQASFAGPSDREDVSLATFEPIINFNLKDGFYLRSTATMNFDLHDGNYTIPVGLGVGKVFQVSDKVTMNAFIEPQYSVFDKGDGGPKWQIFAGLNFQIAIGK